jgi:hypothetical protein
MKPISIGRIWTTRLFPVIKRMLNPLRMWPVVLYWPPAAWVHWRYQWGEIFHPSSWTPSLLTQSVPFVMYQFLWCVILLLGYRAVQRGDFTTAWALAGHAILMVILTDWVQKETHYFFWVMFR